MVYARPIFIWLAIGKSAYLFSNALFILHDAATTIMFGFTLIGQAHHISK